MACSVPGGGKKSSIYHRYMTSREGHLPSKSFYSCSPEDVPCWGRMRWDFSLCSVLLIPLNWSHLSFHTHKVERATFVDDLTWGILGVAILDFSKMAWLCQWGLSHWASSGHWWNCGLWQFKAAVNDHRHRTKIRSDSVCVCVCLLRLCNGSTNQILWKKWHSPWI